MAHILTEHSFRVTQDKIIDRLVKRNEEKLINSIVYDTFADVKFKNIDTSNNEKVVKKSLSHRPKLNSLFATKGVITRKKKLKKVNLERIFNNHTSWSIKGKKENLKNEKLFPELDVPLPKLEMSQKFKTNGESYCGIENFYENNWDLHLIDKMSCNVAQWIVHEKLKEPRDEEDIIQKKKLTALVNRKYGSIESENVELIPENISETDIREFHENCKEIGIDLDRLERAPKPEVIPEYDKVTLGQFVNNNDKQYTEMLELRSKAKRKPTFLTEVESTIPTSDLMKPKILNRKYHFISDNEFEMKLIQGHKVTSALDKRIITIANDKYNLKWQEVYPGPLSLERGIHRGLLRWDGKPEVINFNSRSKSKLEKNGVRSTNMKSKSSNADLTDDPTTPVIQIACKDWQNEWGIAQNWRNMKFRDVRLKLNSIQSSEREEALFSLALGVICARRARGMDIESPLELPEGILEKVIKIIKEESILRIRIIGSIVIKTIPLPILELEIKEILSSAIYNNDIGFPDRVLVSIMSVLYGLEPNHIICESLLKKYLIEPHKYLLVLMKSISFQDGFDLMHSVTAEYLNSGTCEERTGACTVIGQLDPSKLTGPILEKLIWLAWFDQNKKVQSASIGGIGRIIENNEKAMSLCHSQIIQDLSNDQTIIRGLEMIVKLDFVTDRILNLILKCFRNPRGVIRAKICETVTTMKLFNDEIIKNILQVMQFEIIAEIKCAAIGALIELGLVSDEITAALTWAVRFEDSPQCRCQAAKAILDLKLYEHLAYEETVKETVRERIVVEDSEMVQEMLGAILTELKLEIDQVRDQHNLVTRLKSEVNNLCQKQNIIQQISPNK